MPTVGNLVMTPMFQTTPLGETVEHNELLKELLTELKAIRAELKEIKAAVEKSASMNKSEVEAKIFI